MYKVGDVVVNIDDSSLVISEITSEPEDNTIYVVKDLRWLLCNDGDELSLDESVNVSEKDIICKFTSEEDFTKEYSDLLI